MDNDRNQEMVVIENIVEGPIEMRMSPSPTITMFQLVCWRWLPDLLIFLE